MGGGGGGGILRLPEGCIAHAISLTSPRDACRLSAVSTTFRSASESDTVWERFLPSDLLGPLLPRSLGCSSRKALYLLLCDRGLLCPGGLLSLGLDRWSGAKCYMLSARALSIIWGDNPQYWRWISLPDSRFPEVAELLQVIWLEIRGKFETKLLSQRTTYTAYLVFKVSGNGRSFSYHFQESMVAVGDHVSKRSVCLAPGGPEAQLNLHMYQSVMQWRGVLGVVQEEEAEEDEMIGYARGPRTREDGWMEMELGDFYVDDGEEGEVEMSLMEVRGGHCKRGLIVQGIEVRPKRSA